MFDRILMLLEIGLLIWIVVQGEIIVTCERGVYRLQKEREDERRQWREAKRKQQERKTVQPMQTLPTTDGVSLQQEKP